MGRHSYRELVRRERDARESLLVANAELKTLRATTPEGSQKLLDENRQLRDALREVEVYVKASAARAEKAEAELKEMTKRWESEVRAHGETVRAVENGSVRVSAIDGDPPLDGIKKVTVSPRSDGGHTTNIEYGTSGKQERESTHAEVWLAKQYSKVRATYK